MKKIITLFIAFISAYNLQPSQLKVTTASPLLYSQKYINSEVHISDSSNSILITPNFNHTYSYDDELMMLRFNYSEDIIAKKEIKKDEDLVFSISYEAFAKAESFRFDLLNDKTLIEGETHVIEHIDTDQEQVVLGLNGNNQSITEPKNIVYQEGGNIIKEWYRCEFQNRNAVNTYSTIIDTNINYSCDTELEIENLEYDYGSYKLEKLKGELKDGKVLTGEAISFNKVVVKGIESKLYTDSHIIVDPYALNQSITVIAEFEMGRVFKKKIKVFSTSVFENPLVGHSTQANYSFKSTESIDHDWDDEFYFGSNTIDSIIGSGVNYENIYNHKV